MGDLPLHNRLVDRSGKSVSLIHYHRLWLMRILFDRSPVSEWLVSPWPTTLCWNGGDDSECRHCLLQSRQYCTKILRPTISQGHIFPIYFATLTWEGSAGNGHYPSLIVIRFGYRYLKLKSLVSKDSNGMNYLITWRILFADE